LEVFVDYMQNNTREQEEPRQATMEIVLGAVTSWIEWAKSWW